MIDNAPPLADRVVEPCTCLACGCLCDDIRVVVQDHRIVEAEHACSIGRPWFLAPRPGEGHPAATIQGQPIDLEPAIVRASAILRAAKAPVFWGLSNLTIQATQAVLAIADRIGAVVDHSGSVDRQDHLAAFQRVGLISGSLGEVKDRADVVVFWGVDPVVTHPRHWERYSVEPVGRFIPGGRSDRFVIVVGAKPCESSRRADLFVPIDPDRQPEALEVLRSLVRGVAIDPERASILARVPFSTLEDLAQRLKLARYGALFFEDGSEPLFRLIQDLNDGRRFIGIEMGESGNASGASAAMAWQAGAPSSVDFGQGYPRHLPVEATLTERLARREVDTLVLLDHPEVFRMVYPREVVAGMPTIVIAPGATAVKDWPDIAFDAARPGLETGGTVARIDGLMLPLRPALSAGVASHREILDRIFHHLNPNS